LVVVSGVLLLATSYLLVRANLNDPTLNIKQAPPRVHGAGTAGATGRTLPSAIEVSKNLAHKTLSTLILQYGIVLLILVLLGALAAWFVAGRVLRPLRAITSAARQLTSENLSERLALAGPDDELKELGDTFDSMIGRLETSFLDQQLFAANAAHELRTPLAVMIAEIDLLLTSEEPTVLEAQETAVRLRRTLTASEQLIERLLQLTQSEFVSSEREHVRIDELTGQEIEKIRDRAIEQGVTIQDHLGDVDVLGDPQLLRELVVNLLDNALKYNRPLGWIEVSTRYENGESILEIANSGHDLSSEDLDRLLQPFRRAGQARVGTSTGLGLSIIHNIVRAHGGRLTLHALLDGGLTVRVTFPHSVGNVETLLEPRDGR
jgi:signal transduction histidine kinase